MQSFQAVIAILLATMVNMALGAAEIHATALILASTFLSTVASSTFQHAIVAAPGTRGSIGTRKVSTLQANDTGSCYNASTFPHTVNDSSALVPWTDILNKNDTDSYLWLYDIFGDLCWEISETILTRDIPYTHCKSDNYTNGTYSIMAQMTYLGPNDTYDMRGKYDNCIGALVITMWCPYGGIFEHKLPCFGPPNELQAWEVQARPIKGPCPDCAKGLPPPDA
ncbi:hypothetical protein J7T55_004556 [Diaporthe amygdali]|uniref:uncharacterized protein n=1 Tax=Phomopsis amygdali TaxID=1214568 RepID=UPI0022FECEAF|nr:uncharacterized protein J7T55_004556 [Diaporthe amygdali]KAJ0114814.1 hypothetical protein J7T55_004556 [Diaporthe amygdali]